MSDPSPVRSHRAGAFLAATLAFVLVVSGGSMWAHDETPNAIEAFLHGLVEDGAITEVQHQHIDRFYSAGRLSQLHAWLEGQETAGQITSDTHLYVDALLNLSTPAATPAAAAAANYTDSGNVTLLGRIDAQPPSPYIGDNSSTGTLYNGIWGYAAGSREYALQSNSFGLHIIDVTDPAAPFRVQFIDMSGGTSPPKGRIWRDVDTYTDSVGKTYAYVAAQAGGNFWVVDLSYLSETLPDGVDSNPIPPAGIADRGRTNYGHTVFVNRELGLLFLNTANNGSTLGCQIFDLRQNPFDPPKIGSWSGSGRDCHDSFSRGSVPGTGGRDVLYSADGYATRYRVLDITSIRLGGTPTLLGESAPVSGIYAHSNWLDDDSRYLYAFEEFNVRDIGVYDVSNPASPTLVTTFQYSGDATGNSLVHNGQVRGKYLLTAYYEAGFRVFDISNPANPVEVGMYETWRDPDGDGSLDKTIAGDYDGAWNLHAFLPSGNVLVSDTKSGTFIFRVDAVAAPDGPSGLSAAPGNGQAVLAWAAASGATGYSVHRSTASGGPYATVANNVIGTGFTDTGLANGTTYFYVVTATNAGGESGTSNQATATPVSGTPTATVTFMSVGAADGYVLESGETTSVGGSLNVGAKGAGALRVGDNKADRQYKAVLSFDTSAIPDGATIVSATLRLRRGSVSGTNPFLTHGAGWVDLQTGGFSGSTTLQKSDFQAAAAVVRATSLSSAPSNGTWSEGSLNAAGLLAIGKAGVTQFRVYFNLDDNDDLGNDYVGYYSGDASAAADRPQLVVVYQ